MRSNTRGASGLVASTTSGAPAVRQDGDALPDPAARRGFRTAVWGVPLSRAPAAGDVVAGKYRLVRRLGRGSMGEVWVADHRTLREQVAVKLLSRTYAGSELEPPAIASARFLFEAQVAARLSRKTRHIVRVTDHGEEGELTYLVMELLEGRTLEDRLMRFECMTTVEATELVAQIARGLEFAHAEGVLHRDLKPANVFLTRDEEGARLVKLLDFGIARPVDPSRAKFTTANGLAFGTPGYMSPEQIAPSSGLDVHVDLWALATIAYEALTGELPLPGIDPDDLLASLRAGRIVPIHSRNAELPRALGAFFDRAFAPRLQDRYGSASELARAFERAAVVDVAAGGATADDVAAGGAPRPAAVATVRGRTWLRRGGAAVAGVLLLASLGAFVARRSRQQPPVGVDAMAAAAPPERASGAPGAPGGWNGVGDPPPQPDPARALAAGSVRPPGLPVSSPSAPSASATPARPIAPPPPPAAPKRVDKSAIF